jgi:hypothetical protein
VASSRLGTPSGSPRKRKGKGAAVVSLRRYRGSTRTQHRRNSEGDTHARQCLRLLAAEGGEATTVATAGVLDLRASAGLCVISGGSGDRGRSERRCRSWGREVLL